MMPTLVAWKRLSSKNGDLPIPGSSAQQTSAIIIDVDNDGINDFIIGARQSGASLVWFRRVKNGWERYIIDNELLPIEAGGAFYDIDGDGDLDLVFGGDWTSNKVWWWENPHPNYDPNLPWKRYEIKNDGLNQHHDQIFGDFDGDGKAELVFWNQRANKLFIAKIPSDPKVQPWLYVEIYSGHGEGLSSGDIDEDGKIELLAGGRWFKPNGHNGKTNYAAYAIDENQSASRIAVGDLNEDGRLEAVMVPADGIGRLKWYACKGDPKATDDWVGHDLLGFDVKHGHSLAVADFNGDGHLDVFCGEMRKWTNIDDNPEAKMWVFYGDGEGHFIKDEVATGFGVHEAKVGDLDGDGQLDILAKPYNWDTPRVDVWLNLGKSMKPIALHPDNSHYFLFRDKPTILITSAEHYGSVLNLDFDYIPYLNELQSKSFNLTRVFSGAYVEDPSAFKIANNTLAPAPNRFICPWARSSTSGYTNGGNKFDLNAWDEAYFHRLKSFCYEAGKRHIVVELVLFCPYYDDQKWNFSPLNVVNNINGIGEMPRTEALTMKHLNLVSIQEVMVRKIVHELKEFDNLYYEVCNEPYFGGVTLDWQNQIIAVIAEAESTFPHKHLIAQNISNGSAKIENPNPKVSIFNFHYAYPPEAVSLNYSLNKAIGDDETGFKGTGDTHYRMEGWDFITAGGGVYNHLDYSFAVGYENGTFAYPPTQPGGGSQTLREQLKTLKDFIYSFDFISMSPNNSIIIGSLPAGTTARALVAEGRQYAIYIKGGKGAKGGAQVSQSNLELNLPKGEYHVEWLNPLSGLVDKSGKLNHAGGKAKLESPNCLEDMALKIIK